MPSQAEVNDALREVIDPEIGINVIDLGLVYGIAIEGSTVVVKLTMTTPACPLHEYIVAGAEAAVKRLPGVASARVDLVWSPPWEPTRISADARRLLGFGA